MLGSSERVDISFLEDFDTHVIDCIGDGSCMIHAIMQSFYKRYIEAESIGERISLADEFRENLANKLTDINPRDLESRTYYESLGNGTMSSMAGDNPSYSLEKFKDHIKSREYLDNRVIEFIQLVLNKAIFFIYESRNEDGEITSIDMYNYFFHPSGKKSICLYGKDDIKGVASHYDLIGIKEDGVTKTQFGPNHPFVRALQIRMREIYSTFE